MCTGIANARVQSAVLCSKPSCGNKMMKGMLLWDIRLCLDPSASDHYGQPSVGPESTAGVLWSAQVHTKMTELVEKQAMHSALAVSSTPTLLDMAPTGTAAAVATDIQRGQQLIAYPAEHTLFYCDCICASTKS